MMKRCEKCRKADAISKGGRDGVSPSWDLSKRGADDWEKSL